MARGVFPETLGRISSVLLGEHGREGRQELVHRGVCNRREVPAHVAGQGDEHTVGEKLQEEEEEEEERLVTDQEIAEG